MSLSLFLTTQNHSLCIYTHTQTIEAHSISTMQTRHSIQHPSPPTMRTNIEDQENQEEESQEKQPLLLTETQETLIQKAINQTFKSTAHLANLLPTGTVLAFQLLSPIFTNQGHCDHSNQSITTLLLSLCTLSCFLLTFTDSFRDPSGKVRYGFATFRGLWVIDAGQGLPPEMGKSYRMKLIDWVHACMSVLVFAAVALFDQNVVMCFFPKPSEEAQQILLCLPVGIGVVCSMFFVAFPTTRYGIGFPLSPH